MRDLIVMVLVMGLVLSFVCADMGIAANQGANTHRYNGTNSITAHNGSEISTTASGTITATDVQAAIVQIASQIAGAGALQTATQTTITAISGLIATNVQDALAELRTTYAVPPQAGNAGKILTTNGTTASWVNTGDLSLIGTVTLSGTASTAFEFRDIPATYTTLRMLFIGSAVDGSDDTSYVTLRFNDDTSGASIYNSSYSQFWDASTVQYNNATGSNSLTLNLHVGPAYAADIVDMFIENTGVGTERGGYATNVYTAKKVGDSVFRKIRRDFNFSRTGSDKVSVITGTAGFNLVGRVYLYGLK